MNRGWWARVPVVILSVVLIFEATAVAPASTVLAASRPEAQPPVVASETPREPTELTARRTETSRTYDNHDGSYTTELYSQPIHFRPAGSADWAPVAIGFRAASRDSGLLSTSDQAPVAVGLRSSDASAGFLQLESPQARISFALLGAADLTGPIPGALRVVQPVVSERQALYPGLLPEVDLEVIPGVAGAKTFLVLHSAAAASTFTFGVDAPGLSLHAAADGGAEFVDRNGGLVGRMPRPYAVDSSADALRGGGRYGDAVSLTVTQIDGRPALNLAVDPDWLRTAVFPVYLDPTVTFTTGSDAYGDAFVSQAYPTTNFADYVRPDSPYYHELWLGMDPANSNNVNNVLLKFDLASIADASIDSASLSIFAYHQYYNAPTSTTTWVNKVTSANWTESGVTWNNQPGSTAITSGPTVEGQTASFTVTSTVQGWVVSPSSNYGFKLHENGNGATYWKRLMASENGSCCDPELAVTYHRPSASPAATNWTASRTRSWTYTDPLSHAQSHYQVEVATSSGFGTIIASSGVVSGTASSWAIPGGVSLSSGSEYWWRVKVKDGSGWSDWGVSSFIWDTSPPGGSISLNAGAASTDSSAVRVGLTGLDPNTANGYANDGRSLTSLATGCSGVVTCGSSWLSSDLGTDRAEGAVASVGTGSSGSWNALTVDAYTPSNRSTLAMDVKRDSSADVLVGVVSDDNDGFRYQLRADAGGLYALEYTATSTPGSYTTLSITGSFTPGVWYRFMVAPAGGTPGTYNLWWYQRDQAQPASPSLVTEGVYVNKPRLHLWQKGGSTVWLDNLKTSTNASSPWGSGISAVRFSTDGSSWGNWIGYADTLSYVLPVGAGSRTLYAQFRDAAGNTSSSVSDGITATFANLGIQRQHSFETWELGAGDQLSVNAATGNLVVSHPLVILPFRGDDLPMVLTYNSQDAANVGLSAGWRLNLQRRLTINGDNTVTFTDGGGARYTFTNPVVNGTLTTYTRPPALYATLVKDTAQADEFTLTYRDQARDRFDIAGSEALLKRAEDRHANGVDIAYSSGTNISTVTDPSGRQLSFSWNTTPNPDLLTSISDWAYVSGGVVQTTATGSLRQYRFFYSSDILAGWSDALNTSGSCPTGGSHLTCLSYASGLLSQVKKTQTYTTLSGGALGSSTRLATTELTYAGSRVASVRDAQQTAQSGPATTFAVDQADRVVVRRPTTVTTYGLSAAADPYARINSVWRRLDALAEIERRTTWDGSFPTEPATITDNYGALLGTPARSLTYTFVGGSLGNLAKLVESLTASPATNRWTEYVHNANNDVTEVKVSLDGSSSQRTISRYCYNSTASCPSATGLDLLAEVANYVDGIGGSGSGLDDNDTDVRTDYAYDSYGQRTDVTRHNRDASGNLLDERHDRLTFDSYGNLTADIVNYANGTVTSPGDDITPNATTLSRTDLTTSYTYDTAGNRVGSADPRRAILAAAGSPAADDYLTRWTFDALNQQLTETTPTTPGVSIAQKTASSTSDEFGLVRSAIDFGGLVSASEFDRAGRVAASFERPSAESARQTSLTTLDADGRAATAKDERQLADSSLGYSAFAYDALGRQVAIAQAVGTSDASESDRAYDGLDRLLSLEVGVGSAASLLTTYAYDLGGRTIETDDGFTCSQESFDYRDRPGATISGLTGDGCGTGGDQRTVAHTYDGLGRAVRDEITAGSPSGDRTLDDVFDAVGNRRSAATRKGGVTATTSLGVDLLNETVSEARPDGSLAKTTYDPAGNATDHCFWRSGSGDVCLPVGSSWPVDDPDQVTTTASDARNQRISLRNGATNGETTYDPDHNYEVKAIYTPTAASREHQTLYTYDARHRLTAITFQVCTPDSVHACTDSPLSTGSDAYAYDDADNRTQVNENNAGSSADRRYCYDARNQLIYRNTGAACSSSAKDESYEYDPAGNRTKVGTTTFTYSAAGQLTNVGADDLSYDSAGRTKSWEIGSLTWYFTYDAEGRLVSACKSVNCVSGYDKMIFSYDGEGHRTQTVATAAGGTVTTTDFRYQGDAIVEEKVNGTTTRTYVLDDAGTIVKLTVATGQADAGDYLVNWNGHGDALNLLRVNGDGTITLANSFTYGSWGLPTTTTHNSIGDLGFRFLYVGQFDVQWDNTFGLGLHYMHARHYAPALGRFLQPDPDGLEDNLYGYAANNPVTESDPAGTCFIVCAIVGAVVSTGIYLATTDSADWSFGDAAREAAVGAVTGAIGVGLISRVASIGRIGQAANAVARVAGRGAGIIGNSGRVGAATVRVASRVRSAVAPVLRDQRSDWVRFGPTRVSNQVLRGPGATGSAFRYAIRGGGSRAGFSLPFHYHIGLYNLTRPSLWFRYTKILK